MSYAEHDYGLSVDDRSGMNEKRMRLRYAGTCRECGIDLSAKTEAIYERSSKTVRCVSHGQPPEDAEAQVQRIEAGTPGSPARREFERRKAIREERIRTKHPKLGGLILALSEEPKSTRAWDASLTRVARALGSPSGQPTQFPNRRHTGPGESSGILSPGSGERALELHRSNPEVYADVSSDPQPRGGSEVWF
jgi:hypothetical protein